MDQILTALIYDGKSRWGEEEVVGSKESRFAGELRERSCISLWNVRSSAEGG